MLTREHRDGVNRAAESDRGTGRELHRVAVQNRERTWIAEADLADVRIRGSAKGGAAAAENLARRKQLRVYFETDAGEILQC